MVLDKIAAALGVGRDTKAEDDAAKAQVEGWLNPEGGEKIVVFSKSYCPYSQKAKALLTELKQNAQVIELDQIPNGSAIQAYLAARIGASKVTVPQVYIKQQLIGGNSELQAKHQKGELEPLLA